MLFRTMPVDSLPEYGFLPKFTSGVFPRNRFFTGRVETLIEVSRKIKGNTAVAIGEVAVTGFGGVGKTQLANEFVHRYGQFFAGGVFWISFAEPESIMAEVAICGKAMALHPSYHELPLEEQVNIVKSAWQHSIPRLLVFDNCEDEELLNQWRPTGSGSRLLITSRKQTWSPTLGVEAYRLDVMEPPDSVALLCKLCPTLNPDQDPVMAIAEEVGHLPLALHLSGSYLNHFRGVITPEGYLEKLKSQKIAHAALLGKGTQDQPTGHVMNVAKTFQLSFDRLDQNKTTDVLALWLFFSISFLSPGEPIPRDLILNIGPDATETLDALHLLTNLGLLEWVEEANLRCHRLLAYFAEIHRQENPMPNAPQREAVEALLVKEARRINESEKPSALLDWNTHLVWLTDQALKKESPNVDALLYALATHYRAMGLYLLARDRRQQSLELAMATNDLKTIATCQSNLALVLKDLGAYEEARDLLREALAADEASYEPGHPSIAIRQSNLALVLQDLGTYEEARDLLREALAAAEASYEPGHPSIAISQSNLALVLQDLGAYEEARDLLREALAAAEASYEPGHPSIAISQSNLALVLQDLGAYEEARDLLREALAADEASYEPGHPRIATRQSNLALVLQDLGAYEESEGLFLIAFESSKQTLGPNHPKTRTFGNNLAALKNQAKALKKNV